LRFAAIYYSLERRFRQEDYAVEDDGKDLSALENALSARLAQVRRRRAELKKSRIEAGEVERDVTDHAVIRYLERVAGFDVEAIREKLRVFASEAKVSKDGDHYWHPSGVILILGEDGQVVTVLSGDQIEKWVGRKLADGSRAELSPSPTPPSEPA
jgi:hypothetical protein